MKKITIFVFVLFACALLLDGRQRLTAVSAQSGNETKPLIQISQEQLQKDRELAAYIRRVTDRKTEGLVEERRTDGTVSVDLQGRFQNLMLSKLDEEGDIVVDCVTSLEEANSFFGRNLETGEPVSRKILEKHSTAQTAVRHGMSEDEFLFYKKLIEDAEARRTENTNSATITIVNADGAGEGFNDATAKSPEGGNDGTTLGQQRLNLFNFAAGIWGAYLDSNVTIRVNSQFNSLTPCSTSGGVLGSSSTVTVNRDFPNAEFAGTWYHAALSNKRAGEDLDEGTQDEIRARFNSDVDTGCLGGGSRFYYGLNNSTPSNTVNLLIVLLHEMGHGLGFSSFVNGTAGTLFNGFPDIYTRYMFDRTANTYWYQMTDAQRQASAVNAGNVFWDGPNSKIASGFLTNGRDTSNGRVSLYTPTTFQSGSSISHWNTTTSPNLLMEPNITTGLPTSLDLTRQLMRDIGWYRDTAADLVPDTITNVFPSGGGVQIGTDINITWTNNGGFNRNVTIELSTDGGATYTAIATNIANTGSFAFTVPNTPTTQGRIRVREYDFADPAGVSSANFAIGSTPVPATQTPFDYDGDHKTDISIFRPSNGQWWIQRSTDNVTNAVAFGTSTDKIVPADYDGDGKTDVAFWRPSTGEWFVLRSSNQTFFAAPFGVSTDVPAPGDFDADGKADLTVFRPSNGTWFISRTTGGVQTTQFGVSGDIPVVADYDGDNKSDIAIFRPAGSSGSGEWWISRSTAGLFATQFGAAGDKPVVGDYTGDSKADVAFFRPSNATWFVLRSDNLTFFAAPFGLSTDTPVAGDYDGDGKNDFAVFRPSNVTWFASKSTGGTFIQAFGTASDIPTPSAFVR